MRTVVKWLLLVVFVVLFLAALPFALPILPLGFLADRVSLLWARLFPDDPNPPPLFFPRRPLRRPWN